MPAAVGDILEFHRGDALLKLLSRSGLTRRQLAKRAGLRPNTITNLLNNNVESEMDTLRRVCEELKTSLVDVDDLVAQMNGRPKVVALSRSRDEREEDRDPQKREAQQYVQRIVSLPIQARLLVYNLVAVLESAFRAKSS